MLSVVMTSVMVPLKEFSRKVKFVTDHRLMS
jgi:hypothetical protein